MERAETSDRRRMRALALTLAVTYLLANAGAALLMSFLATFPFENQTPEQQAGDDWMIGVGIVAAFLALITLIAVVRERQGWARLVFAANAVLGFALLRWAVGVSDRSDGKLVVWFLAIESTVVGAVALNARRAAH